MSNMLKNLIKKLKGIRENDPIYNCQVYNTVGCSHVDGLLCDMETCNILKEHREED
jgi:hypothetical protein